jgi:5'-deoxynucleotidase YfbR-like HD superfamily hydrolase
MIVGISTNRNYWLKSAISSSGSIPDGSWTAAFLSLVIKAKR